MLEFFFLTNMHVVNVPNCYYIDFQGKSKALVIGNSAEKPLFNTFSMHFSFHTWLLILVKRLLQILFVSDLYQFDL